MAQTRKRSKPRGASRPQRKAPRSLPGWVWLVSGVVIGVFVTMLFQLAPNTVDLRQVAKQPGMTPTSKAGSQPVDNPQQPVFDFYTKLAQNEVKASTPKQAQVPSTTPQPAVITPAPVTSTVVDTADRYILQAGSFRRSTDADKVRAKLLLLGLDAKVKKVQVENGDEWNRVQVGPFSSSSELQKARQILVSNQMQPLVLKLK